MDLFKKCESLVNVKTAKEKGIYPYFHRLNSKQGPEVVMEGKDIIMIGSNNYLGLTSHPEVIAAGKTAIEKYGSGCSGSRFLNGTLEAHVQLESELAEAQSTKEALDAELAQSKETVVGYENMSAQNEEAHNALTAELEKAISNLESVNWNIDDVVWYSNITRHTLRVNFLGLCNDRL